MGQSNPDQSDRTHRWTWRLMVGKRERLVLAEV